MRCITLLLLVFIVGTELKSLKRSKLKKDFKSICGNGESVSGLASFVTKAKKQSDIRFLLFCRDVDPKGKFKSGKCRDAKPFDFFNGKGKIIANNKFGSASNCKKGEYLAGIKSKYSKKKSVRTFQYHCCQSKNAVVDDSIGCHHVGPIKPFNGKDMYVIKSKIVAKSACPRDAISGIELTKKGFVLKFCPFKVKGAKYSKACKKIKKGVKTFKETDGTNGKPYKKDKNKKKNKKRNKNKKDGKFPKLPLTAPEETIEIEHSVMTSEEQDFRIECNPGSAFDEGLFKSGPSGDLEMKLHCGDVKQEGMDSEAERVYQTKFFKMKEFGKKDGCKKQESLNAIVSQFRDNERYISVKCVDQSNAKVVKGSVEEVRLGVIGKELKLEVDDNLKVVRTIYFETKGDVVTVVLVFARYKYNPKARFEEDKYKDDTIKQLEQHAKKRGKVEIVVTTKAPVDEGFLVNEGKEGQLKTLDEIPEILENQFTEGATDWKIICPFSESLSAFSLKRKGRDIEIMYQCREVVPQESIAEKVRWTEWTAASSMTDFTGCEKEEVVGGLASQFDIEAGDRIFSHRCTELSNAVIKPDSFAKVMKKELTEAGIIVTASDEFTLQNFWIEVLPDLTMIGHFHYSKFEYFAYEKFKEDILIDQTLTGAPPESEECICICSNICNGTEAGNVTALATQPAGDDEYDDEDDEYNDEDDEYEDYDADENRKRQKRRFRRKWKKQTDATITKLSFTTVKMKVIKELNELGINTFVLIPTEPVDRCPDDQCNCMDTCPVVPACELPWETAVTDEYDEEGDEYYDDETTKPTSTDDYYNYDFYNEENGEKDGDKDDYKDYDEDEIRKQRRRRNKQTRRGRASRN